VPAQSKQQQRFMGAALNCKRTGKCGSPAIEKAAGSMSIDDLRDFAGTKHKGLPYRKPEKLVAEGEIMKLSNNAQLVLEALLGEGEFHKRPVVKETLSKKKQKIKDKATHASAVLHSYPEWKKGDPSWAKQVKKGRSRYYGKLGYKKTNY